jgi:hypothetical protein
MKVSNRRAPTSNKKTKTLNTSSRGQTTGTVAPPPKQQQQRRQTAAATAVRTKAQVSRSVPQPNKGRKAGHATNRTTSIATFVQKSLPPNETSLFAVLLRSVAASSSKKKKPSTLDLESTAWNAFTGDVDSSPYTEAIRTVLQAFLTNLQQDTTNHLEEMTNLILLQAYNLIFRSVGGTTLLPRKTDNDEEEDMDTDVASNKPVPNLEDMSDDEWTQHIDQIVEEMSDPTNSNTNAVTLSTKAILMALSSSSAVPSNAEYLNVYTEFWYHFTIMILTNNNGSRLASKDEIDKDDDDDDDDDDEKDATQSSNGRFQVELIRQIVSRLIDLVNVGVPDIRYALCIAIYQIGSALLLYTTQLQAKVAPAQRQFNVAKRNKHKTKAQTLDQQIQLWNRTIADCEVIVKELIITTVFTIRYKDQDPMIRTLSLRTLSHYSLVRSDIFLLSFYLKYFGWMMSDKHPVVRTAALHGLMQPLRQHAQSQDRRGTTSLFSNDDVDVTTQMAGVLTKFLPRIVDCVIDIDVAVQETAMEFVLLLLRETEFFNDMDNERIWIQINVRALDPHTSHRVRKYALYFVMEQLNVSGNTADADTTTTTLTSHSSERDVVKQLYTVGKWYVHNTFIYRLSMTINMIGNFSYFTHPN